MRKIKSLFACAVCIIMMLNTILVNAVTFDIQSEVGSPLSDIKLGQNKPYIQKKPVTAPFYIDNDLLKPVFRMKFDEGTGNTVTESVSGKTFNIEGNDYEWINDADIRQGSLTSGTIKQKSSLRLNNSYINLGNIDSLAGISGEVTIAFWTDFEIFGRNDDYVEKEQQQYTETKTYGTYSSAYKYDTDRRNVIFQSDNAKMCLAGQYWYFDGVDSRSIGFSGSLKNTNYYNMYIICIKKMSDGTWKGSIYGNDRQNPDSAFTMTSWGDDTKLFNGNLYIGTPSPSGKYGSMQLGIADLMVFDKAMSYQQRLELFYEYRQAGYYADGVPTE